MKKIITCLLVIICTTSLLAQQATQKPYSVLPQPNEIKYEAGEFNFKYDFGISYPISLLQEAMMMRTWLCNDFRMNPVLKERKDAKATAAIELVLDKTLIQGIAESYQIIVNNKGITVKANSKAGILYGIQSLRQIITPTENGFTVRCGTITDYPSFGWRAFMLDESRYFKGKEVVFRLLDEMAQLKMNIFHWHLADDQGWRIEIKKYPRLTEIGGFRDSTEINHFHSNIFNGTPHGGFYTQEEIKEVVRYAAERNITVVPEIEMPGHASSSIAAYPWLGTTGKEIKVPGYFGVMYDVYDVSNPCVVTFLEEVLEEVLALFPSEVIHIGGDEVRFDQWEASKSVKDYMKQLKLKSPAELQVHFTNQMSNWFSQKNRKMMGWNEITGEKLHDYQSGKSNAIGNKLAQGTIVHFWKGDPTLINKSLENGYNIVNSYHVYTYLDYDYNSIPLSKSYSFNPIPEGLSKGKEKQVLGLGCQMWCEFVPDVQSLNKKVFPRIAAYAETGWTKTENKNYDNFQNSLRFFLAKWQKQGIEYGPVN